MAKLVIKIEQKGTLSTIRRQAAKIFSQLNGEAQVENFRMELTLDNYQPRRPDFPKGD